MPADAEELELAIRDGVDWRGLLSPEAGSRDPHLPAHGAGRLDESGRRRPVETEERVQIPADSVIAALGAKG